MTDEQIKTAMAVAWLEFEQKADAYGDVLSEHERLVWTAGFASGGKVACAELKEGLKPGDDSHET